MKNPLRSMTGTVTRSLCIISLLMASTTTLAADNDSSNPASSPYPQYPSVQYGSGNQAAQLKRGEYLIKMGDCIACHTAPEGGKPFAGQYPVETPFGTIYAPNITPDKETGIGSWSEADFEKAMQHGILPKGKLGAFGSFYYPAFPYLYFNTLKKDDLKDMWAYLQAIPAVHQANRDNDMMFPFNFRLLQLGWRVMFFYMQQSGPYQDDPSQSKAWNRGNYLVNGLGHCAMCHTPSYYMLSEKYSLGAPRRKYALTGSMIQGFFAPNITGKTLKDIPVNEIEAVFKKDELIGGGAVQGPMLEANHNSLKYLKHEDVVAIATYLKSVKSKTLAKKKVSGSGVEQGKAIYDKYCTGCHTTGAGGAFKLGDASAWTPLVKQGMDTLYKNAINGIGGMPPKGSCSECTDQEIQYAVDYIVSQAQPGSASASGNDAPPASTPPKALTLQDGKAVYTHYCAACHAPGTTYANAPKLGDEAAWKPIIKQGMDIVILNTLSGTGNMAPRGSCTSCNDAEIKAAVKYMVQESQSTGDYSRW